MSKEFYSMKVLILGANGMAGHAIAKHLVDKGYEVHGFAREVGPIKNVRYIIGDATDTDELARYIRSGNYGVIVNCIGILNKQCDENPYAAITLNSALPHLLVDIVKHTPTRIIHISTDCVFSGSRPPYYEYSIRDADSIYGRTKALGEIDDAKNLTFRTSIVGPDIKSGGIGLLNWFMKQEGEVSGYTQVSWTGVTTIVLAKAIDKAIKSGLAGLYHLVNDDVISKYEMLELFNKLSGKKIVINAFENRPVGKVLENNRKDFKFKVPSYVKMMEDMFKWIKDNKELYSHYK